MRELIYVAVGGATGSVLRYLTYIYLPLIAGRSSLLTATLAVNVLGCLLIGFLVQWMELRQILDHSLRLLLLTGFLGGFTTFSAFGYEGLELFRNSTSDLLLYIALHLLLGIGGVWLGSWCGQWMFQG